MTALVGAAGLLVGALCGAWIRRLLAQLRRGTVVRPGPLEAITAVVTSIGASVSWSGPLLPLVLWCGLLGVAGSVVDVRHHRLPDALTLPAIPVTIAIVVGTCGVAPGSGSIAAALIAGLVVGALFALPALLARGAMGWGDVKLSVSIGVATGLVGVETVLIAVFLAFLTAAVVALGGIVAGRWTTRTALPFGPFLLFGGWAALLWAAV